MKVYIAVDMEGLSGVVHSCRTVSVANPQAFLEAREWMVAEANAAIEGAVQGGATEILVNDVHWPMRNLIVDRLDHRARLISGFNKPWFTLQGLDDSIDLMFCIGYHGTASMVHAVLGHTYLSKEILRIDGNSENQLDLMELSVEALVAGEKGVPIGLVTGDEATIMRARDLLGPIEMVVVKLGLDRYAADSLTLDEACRRITAAAKRAIERIEVFQPLRTKLPTNLRVEFANASHVARLAWVPGVEKISSRVVTIEGKTWCEVYARLAICVQTVAQNIDPYY